MSCTFPCRFCLLATSNYFLNSCLAPFCLAPLNAMPANMSCTFPLHLQILCLSIFLATFVFHFCLPPLNSVFCVLCLAPLPYTLSCAIKSFVLHSRNIFLPHWFQIPIILWLECLCQSHVFCLWLTHSTAMSIICLVSSPVTCAFELLMSTHNCNSNPQLSWHLLSSCHSYLLLLCLAPLSCHVVLHLSNPCIYPYALHLAPLNTNPHSCTCLTLTLGCENISSSIFIERYKLSCFLLQTWLSILIIHHFVSLWSYTYYITDLSVIALRFTCTLYLWWLIDWPFIFTSTCTTALLLTSHVESGLWAKFLLMFVDWGDVALWIPLTHFIAMERPFGLSGCINMVAPRGAEFEPRQGISFDLRLNGCRLSLPLCRKSKYKGPRHILLSRRDLLVQVATSWMPVIWHCAMLNISLVCTDILVHLALSPADLSDDDPVGQRCTTQFSIPTRRLSLWADMRLSVLTSSSLWSSAVPRRMLGSASIS